MMNKQEAIEELQSEARYHCGEKEYYRDDCTKNVELDIAIDIVSQIDEPEIVELPEYVDTWYQGAKYNGFDLYEAMTDDEIPDRVDSWIQCNPETFVKAWLYGYEVEKEKLYTVEIPNPNSSTKTKVYLAKNKDSKVELFSWTGYPLIIASNGWKKEKNAQLTEKEIKEDFDWAWQFAEEVK